MHPVLARLGPITLHTYGVVFAIAVLVAMQWAMARARHQDLPTAHLLDLILWILVGGLVGARLVYVFQHWSFYATDPAEILRLDHGGLVFYGGFLGGAVVGVYLLRRWRLPGHPSGEWVGKIADLLVPSLALAQAIGRIGCFFNGCCYGEPTTWAWGVQFPHESFARHPTQLLESAALFLLAGLLFWRARRPMAPGTLVGWYLIGYGVWRFAVEFLRGDNPMWLGSLTFSQVVSAPLVLIGLWLAQRQRQVTSDK